MTVLDSKWVWNNATSKTFSSDGVTVTGSQADTDNYIELDYEGDYEVTCKLKSSTSTKDILCPSNALCISAPSYSAIMDWATGWASRTNFNYIFPTNTLLNIRWTVVDKTISLYVNDDLKASKTLTTQNSKIHIYSNPSRTSTIKDIIVKPL